MNAAAPAEGTIVQWTIGDVTTTITSRDPELTLTTPPAVARFATGEINPDMRVDARWGIAEPRAAGRLLFDSGGLWQLHEADEQLTWRFTSPKFGALPYKTAVFDKDFSSGTVSLHRPYFDASAAVYPLEYPLDELLVTNWLALGRGVEIHGCAVLDTDGTGYLFAGHSGAGKSTIAALWKSQSDATILSDDRVILRKAEGRIWMYGTPWHGEEPLASPTRTLLTRGFFLRHGSSNRLAGVGTTQAVAGLLARSFPPFFSPDGLAFTMALLADVSQAVTFSELEFLPDRRVIDFLRAAR